MNFGSGRSTYGGGLLGGSSGARIAAKSLDARVLGDKAFRYVYDDFRYVDAMKLGGGAAAGATGDINKLFTGNLFNMPYEYAIIGAGQTIIVPVLNPATDTQGAGIDIGLDQTLNEGLEIIFGAQHAGVAGGRLAFKSQTDRSFFAKATVCIEDASGAYLLFGFKKAIAFNTVANYTDYAIIGLTSQANPDGTVNTATRLNSGSVTTTDTGKDWADNGTHTLCVVVNGNGVASFYFDGALNQKTPAFTFDAADYLVPFLRFENETDLAGAVVLQEFEAGFCAPQGS